MRSRASTMIGAALVWVIAAARSSPAATFAVDKIRCADASYAYRGYVPGGAGAVDPRPPRRRRARERRPGALASLRREERNRPHRPRDPAGPAHSKATSITTNLDYEDWAGFLGNKALVSALLSRLRHHCHTIRIEGPSLRDPQG